LTNKIRTNNKPAIIKPVELKVTKQAEFTIEKIIPISIQVKFIKKTNSHENIINQELPSINNIKNLSSKSAINTDNDYINNIISKTRKIKFLFCC
jgi:hypothetical protein